jgi:malonate transporter
MNVLIESLLPIFLLIMLGWALKRVGFVAEESWPGMERITFYVLFPALLIQTITHADFGDLAAAGASAGFALGTMLLLILMVIAKPLLQPALGLSSPSYSSLYQGVTRWNAFIVLAVAEKIATPDMLAVVAIAIGVMIIPINIFNIAVIATWCRTEGEKSSRFKHIATNPLILGVVAGAAIRVSGLSIPGPVETSMAMLARVALPFSLILVGAGLRLKLPGGAYGAIAVGTILKLLLMPALLGGSAWLFGVRGEELVIVALCGAGPSAMNGYVVARQMGGDAPLFAALVTVQTIVAFFTIPLVLAVAELAG